MKASKTFGIDIVNKHCSRILFENREKGWKNEDVYFLVRYAVSGNPVGAPMAEICDVIGKDQTIVRL